MIYQKKVCIIIPVFNVQQHFLVEALDSAINQTYHYLEIIIVDDGSTDNSRKTCDDFSRKDNRVCVVHQSNKGLSAARNIGLDIMTGDAVVFLDADDALVPEYVERMLSAMENSDADVVICKYSIQSSFVNEQQVQRKTGPTIEPGVYDRVNALNGLVDAKINHSVWNKMYLSSLWENIRFPEGRVYEDVDTTYRILDMCKKTVVINDVLYLYRVHSGSITDTCTKEKIEDGLLAIEHFCSFIQKNTPDIFTNDQLKKCRQIHLKGLIGNYVRLINSNCEGDVSFREELKKIRSFLAKCWRCTLERTALL